MVHAEWALAALDGHGLAPETMLDLHVLLYSHVHGIAVHLEREAQAEAATGLSEDQWMDRQAPAFAAITSAARYPVFTRIASGCRTATTSTWTRCSSSASSRCWTASPS
ncbi:hypothetical protein [Kitasatospora sp. NPDC057936]|uniref:hypothetical protein n=1 Tax=Kitasatospora sp. NPDC057936 TaxID=3346283 RepID=UPI0036D8F838